MSSTKRAGEEQKGAEPKKLCMSSNLTKYDSQICYPDYLWDETVELPTPRNLNDPKKLCMPTILSIYDFQNSYPDYKYDKTVELPTPRNLNDQCVYTIIKDLAKRLVQCDRAVVIDNETSKYPFVYELLKYLVRLCDAHYTVKNVELEPNDLEMVAEEFVQNSEEQLEHETTVDTIMRWERHFKSLKSPLGMYGYVEFNFEKEGQVIKMVEVKDSLGNNIREVESCVGFFQACGEAARACENNVANAKVLEQSAIKIRKARAISDIHEREVNFAKSFRRFPVEWKADREAQAARYEEDRRAAVEAEKEDQNNLAAAVDAAKRSPVYVVLTSFSKWVFIKAQNKVITSSRVLTVFPGMFMEPNSAFVDVIQFMTHGLGINLTNVSLPLPATANLRDAEVTDSLLRRLALTESSDNGMVRKFIGGVYADCQTFIDAFRIARLSEEDVERLFKKRFPEALWEEFAPRKEEKEEEKEVAFEKGTC